MPSTETIISLRICMRTIISTNSVSGTIIFNILSVITIPTCSPVRRFRHRKGPYTVVCELKIFYICVFCTHTILYHKPNFFSIGQSLLLTLFLHLFSAICACERLTFVFAESYEYRILSKALNTAPRDDHFVF